MGRTKRIRKVRRKPIENISLEHEENIILLKKWMSRLGWENRSKLILKNFQETGRGVSSQSRVKINQILIEIPYQLLITFATVVETEVIITLKKTNRKYKTQDILAMFLVMERHKNEKSKWKYYIDTLPEKLPRLPWLCDVDELSAIPSDFSNLVRKRKWDFETSWERVEKSIDSSYTCYCCREPLDRVITLNAFTWGYVMVNTRAVYVRPDFVVQFFPQDLSRFLSDAPCLALCPFLDMFNHSANANTKADLSYNGDSYNYTLTTLTSYKQHEQIFISYGPHDNDKLFCEYGFFIPQNNILDSIQLSLEDIISGCKVKLNKKQHNFVKKLLLDNELYVSVQGISFNLKGLIYVITKADNENWSRVIFSENYLESDLLSMRLIVKELLILKQRKYLDAVNHLGQKLGNESIMALINFHQHKTKFIGKILDILPNNCI